MMPTYMMLMCLRSHHHRTAVTAAFSETLLQDAGMQQHCACIPGYHPGHTVTWDNCKAWRLVLAMADHQNLQPTAFSTHAAQSRSNVDSSLLRSKQHASKQLAGRIQGSVGCPETHIIRMSLPADMLTGTAAATPSCCCLSSGTHWEGVLRGEALLLSPCLSSGSISGCVHGRSPCPSGPLLKNHN